MKSNGGNVLDNITLAKAIRLAEKYQKQDENSKAVKICRDILIKFPKNQTARKLLQKLGSQSVGDQFTIVNPPVNDIENLVRLYQSCSYDELKRILPGFLERYPNSTSLLKIAGMTYTKLNELEKAITYYLRIIETSTLDIKIAINLGNLYHELRDYNKAIEYFDNALSLNPNNADAHYNKGNALQSLGRIKDAIISYQRSIEFDPDNYIAYANLGTTLKDDGQLNKSIEVLTQALNLSPDNPTILNNIGVVVKEQGNLADAETFFSQAIAVTPDYLSAKLNLGIVKRELNQYTVALEIFNDALRGDLENFQIYYNLGITHASLGNTESAIECYRNALRIKPSSAQALNNLGSLLQNEGKITEALGLFDKSIHSLGVSSDAYVNMVSLRCQLQHLKRQYNSSRNEALQMHANSTHYPRLLILYAIEAFLKRELMEVSNYLKLFDQLAYAAIEKMHSTDRVFCIAYRNYLGELAQNFSATEAESGLYHSLNHIGESHCLSYAHQNFQLNDIKYNVRPHLTLGAKAFHFTTKHENIFKAVTKANLENLPKSEKIFISFGEIDCRPNEGFITAAKKLNHSVHDLISNVVPSYVQWFMDQGNIKGQKIYFVNVPAPVHLEQYNEEINAMAATTVALFNKELHNQINHCNAELIDVHAFTTDDDGFSNKLYHIDNIHLGPIAIPEIEKQLQA